MKRKILFIILAILVASSVALYFIFRTKPQIQMLPTVEVEEITTEDINIYGEYVGRIRAQSNLWKFMPEWKDILKA